MELYEIVKLTHKPYKGTDYFEPEVITATMDKDLAEKMLKIYQSNQNMNESYQIRTLKEPEVFTFDTGIEHCSACNSYCHCVDIIENHPNTMVRCIRFGNLQKSIKKQEN